MIDCYVKFSYSALHTYVYNQIVGVSTQKKYEHAETVLANGLQSSAQRFAVSIFAVFRTAQPDMKDSLVDMAQLCCGYLVNLLKGNMAHHQKRWDGQVGPESTNSGAVWTV